MSENMLTTTAAQMAWFLAGSWAIAAGETAKPRVLYALNPVDREILAFETLGLSAGGRTASCPRRTSLRLPGTGPSRTRRSCPWRPTCTTRCATVSDVW